MNLFEKLEVRKFGEFAQTQTNEITKFPISRFLALKTIFVMHQQFMTSASAQLNYKTTDELRDIFGNDDKLDEIVDEIVSLCCCSFLKLFTPLFR